MKYTRKELKAIDKNGWGTAEHQQISQDLITRLTEKKPLSLAEADCACQIYNLLQSDDQNFKPNPLDFVACIPYCFKDRYLVYYNDCEGYGVIENFDGIATPEQKKKDVAYLERCHQEWILITSHNRHENPLLNHIVSETNHQSKEIERYCKRSFLGYNKELHLKKSILLHSRYMFDLVSEFYEEVPNQEQAIEICGKKVVIDSFAYIHILFRHYSKTIKEHQVDKTYHFDTNIDYKEIPNVLYEILTQYKKNGFEFDGKCIDFILRNQIYSMWFRPFTRHSKGNVKETFLRLQTFYPVEKEPDIGRAAAKTEFDITNELKMLV